MLAPLPTREDVDRLLAYLPLLYADGFQPFRSIQGGQRDADGNMTIAWPEYEPVVQAFFGAARSPCWMDTDYVPTEAAAMLRDRATVERASLAELRSLLTYCVRGERFSDGHWAAVIRHGHVRAILERLQALRDTIEPATIEPADR